MKKNLKYFLFPFLLAIFWWTAESAKERLDYFFYWREMATDPILLASQENQLSFENHIKELRPFRVKTVSDLEIEAKSVISIFIDNQGREKILFGKDVSQKLPVASLTKLMTAKIVLDNYDLSSEILISEEAIKQEENFGKLSADKILTAEYLLYPLLMESSNDAAYALANDYDGMNEKKFVRLMNEESYGLGLINTLFFNPMGLDPEASDQNINYSTVFDLAKLTKNLLDYPLLWEILSTAKFDTYGPELINTNELLDKLPGVVGGKTGYTEKALGCFVLVLKAPKSSGYIINVILGANGTSNRFREMEKLINWLDLAYKW